MGRKRGPDREQRKRRTATDAELARKAERRMTAQAKQRRDAQAAAKTARAAFVQQMGGGAPSAAGGAADAADATSDDDEIADDAADAAEPSGGGSDGNSDGEEAAAAPDDGVEDDEDESDERPFNEARPADVEAELDDDETDAPAQGVMAVYLKAVYQLVHSETISEASGNAFEQKWLLGMLKAHGQH